MTPIPLTWGDFADGKAKDVVVETLYCEIPGGPVLTALIPARAYRSHDGYLVVEYFRYVHLQPIMRRMVYGDHNYPLMHLKEKLRLNVQLLLAFGALVLWDKESDRQVKSNEIQWWDLWKDKPWFAWSNETGDYTQRYYEHK